MEIDTAKPVRIFNDFWLSLAHPDLPTSRDPPAAAVFFAPMINLAPLLVDKPWGMARLPAPFVAPQDRCIGEIWFEAASQEAVSPLLVKYLFTSEKLSIQVHPDDEQARARGHPSGKEECWYILDAKPGARLGIGTIRPLGRSELHSAALNGELERLIQWHPVQADMMFHIPPGTIHAIGPGITLLEVQQASDITYRLYDYGRPRELHLVDGTAVADARPFPARCQLLVDRARSALLLEANHFKIAHITDDNRPIEVDQGENMLLIPLTGSLDVDGTQAAFGDCMLVQRKARFRLAPGSRALLAWSK